MESSGHQIRDGADESSEEQRRTRRGWREELYDETRESE
jgi:hypothetical protein